MGRKPRSCDLTSRQEQNASNPALVCVWTLATKTRDGLCHTTKGVKQARYIKNKLKNVFLLIQLHSFILELTSCLLKSSTNHSFCLHVYLAQ